MEAKKVLLSTLVSVAALVATAGLVARDLARPTVKPRVVGDYIEARTCDVWTGPCFSNSEINLDGKLAVLGWSIRQGSWEGVSLAGLKVAASLHAEGTLGTKAEGKVRAVVYVDEKADARQRKALVSLAKKLAPKYLENVVKVKSATVRYVRGLDRSSLEVRSGKGAELKVATKPLNAHCDTICGNEEKAYPSLSKYTRTQCAKTVTHFYRGSELGRHWSDPGARSAMTGHFSL